MNQLKTVKKSISARLSKSQKEKLKQVVPFLGLPITKVQVAKHKLNNLGFVSRGLQELEDLYNNAKRANFKQYAAFELALWHMNQYTQEDAQKALDYLEVHLSGEENEEKVRRGSILAIEAMNLLGAHSNARNTADLLLKKTEHADVYFARANSEEEVSSRVAWINKVFKQYHLLEIRLDDKKVETLTPYDGLKTKVKKEIVNNEALHENKVTVLMPVYEAENQIHTALQSIQAQTWTNLEIIVIDDHSQDKTVETVKKYAEKDERIRVLQAPKNGGPYVARNIALKEATGKFITINDADDWSHPEKIEKQVKHLLEHAEVMGNMSEQARMFDDLSFFRRGRPGEYIFKNMSSFMFRREEVLAKLGHWDPVRFAADSEFIFRVKNVFGELSVVELETGPLSFQRHSKSSLTGSEAFGLPNYKMGARREYEMAHDHHHKYADDLYYDFPQEERPFAVPEPMLPEKELKENGFRTFDKLYAADFRQETALSEDFLEKLKAEAHKKIGFVQFYRYEESPFTDVHHKYRKMINDGTAEMIVYGEKVKTPEMVFTDPQSLLEEQKYVPEIKAEQVTIADAGLKPEQQQRITGNAGKFTNGDISWI
ncbi:glycosyltransferase family 2 protein [Alkalicoccus daliensis]|uniref:Glycosyl transferase family 2 n=1 Tax=Alkalicoccus daliensis TaxID=745820 RepID=A0A1H0GIM7_9BACI|nr:glycosyltransferase family A protein [Alkalicoccus daliensis]SDO06766.1 Glycosyl transferase family 2 [Alkalicoccus daliensis]